MDIYGDNYVIGSSGDDIGRGYASGYGYVYSKIGGEWINNGKIVPEDGAAGDNFGCSFSFLVSTALFGAPLVGNENSGSADIVGNNAYIYLNT